MPVSKKTLSHWPVEKPVEKGLKGGEKEQLAVEKSCAKKVAILSPALIHCNPPM